jgi:hypothetical protein
MYGEFRDELDKRELLRVGRDSLPSQGSFFISWRDYVPEVAILLPRELGPVLDGAYLFKIFGPLLPYLVLSPPANERAHYLAVKGFALYEREPI